MDKTAIREGSRSVDPEPAMQYKITADRDNVHFEPRIERRKPT